MYKNHIFSSSYIYVMDVVHAHIEIHFKFDNEKYHIYEVEDNDKALIFSNYLFLECYQDFINCEQDILRKISVEDLVNRYRYMSTKVMIPEHISYKIESLIKYISKNINHYEGVKVILDCY